jgi:hypothetical protein
MDGFHDLAALPCYTSKRRGADIVFKRRTYAIRRPLTRLMTSITSATTSSK